MEGARFEARLMLEAATGLDQSALLRDPDRVVDVAPFRRMVERRAGREPLAFILGWQEFWSLRFRVSPSTLIPRADSETLIEAVLAARPGGVGRILDLGTGTGCLLLATLSEMPTAWGVGLDRNPAAAALALQNAAVLGMAGRCAMVVTDWAAPIAGRFDLVLSNPPYIETATVAGLMPEVARFEPRGALDGGVDGLDAYRVIVRSLDRLMETGALAVLEVGRGQHEAVARLAEAEGFRSVSKRADLAGVVRAVSIER
ncbi:MAG: peptide chain release factor N(5)-glutamine methyltransferase [Pseudomonadota bacterium]|nr:peptide chain release factor N(5)-glutamine methyltransferase [Pseudomonadota bacterium]